MSTYPVNCCSRLTKWTSIFSLDQRHSPLIVEQPPKQRRNSDDSIHSSKDPDEPRIRASVLWLGQFWTWLTRRQLWVVSVSWIGPRGCAVLKEDGAVEHGEREGADEERDAQPSDPCPLSGVSSIEVSIFPGKILLASLCVAHLIGEPHLGLYPDGAYDLLGLPDPPLPPFRSRRLRPVRCSISIAAAARSCICIRGRTRRRRSLGEKRFALSLALLLRMCFRRVGAEDVLQRYDRAAVGEGESSPR